MAQAAFDLQHETNIHPSSYRGDSRHDYYHIKLSLHLAKLSLSSIISRLLHSYTSPAGTDRPGVRSKTLAKPRRPWRWPRSSPAPMASRSPCARPCSPTARRSAAAPTASGSACRSPRHRWPEDRVASLQTAAGPGSALTQTASPARRLAGRLSSSGPGMNGR